MRYGLEESPLAGKPKIVSKMKVEFVWSATVCVLEGVCADEGPARTILRKVVVFVERVGKESRVFAWCTWIG